jgi:hypothetical protein
MYILFPLRRVSFEAMGKGEKIMKGKGKCWGMNGRNQSTTPIGPNVKRT